VSEHDDWAKRGLCRGLVHIFFQEVPEEIRGYKLRAAIRDDYEVQAKKLCNVCPVQAQCTRYSLGMDDPSTYQPYGIWAGLNEEERAEIYRRRVAKAG